MISVAFDLKFYVVSVNQMFGLSLFCVAGCYGSCWCAEYILVLI